jgi:hypothetical protein
VVRCRFVFWEWSFVLLKMLGSLRLSTDSGAAGGWLRGVGAVFMAAIIAEGQVGWTVKLLNIKDKNRVNEIGIVG